MQKKTFKRKIYSLFSEKVQEEDIEELTIFLKKQILKKGYTLIELILRITFIRLFIIFKY